MGWSARKWLFLSRIPGFGETADREADNPLIAKPQAAVNSWSANCDER